MYRNLLLAIAIMSPAISLWAQMGKLSGTVTNANKEPLAFATLQVKDSRDGTTTRENGTYDLPLFEGKYEIIVTMVGYKPWTFVAVIGKGEVKRDIVLEQDNTGLEGVNIKARLRDKAEEYIRNVIRIKDSIAAAPGAYSCVVYIKAVQEDSTGPKKIRKPMTDSMRRIHEMRLGMDKMAMGEVIINLDRSGDKIKEERTGVKKRGDANDLFYLSTTQGDFNFYNNLVSVPGISQTTFLSPVSYSGLLAYKYKTLKTETINGRKVYTIGIKPRQLSNATVEGEIVVAGDTWTILHTRIRFPKYHLAEYDFFEVEQEYSFVQDKAWMLTRQELTYNGITSKKKSSGRTVVIFRDYELNKTFDKKHFGSELGLATEQAYKRDSTFWQTNRAEPLTAKEIRFIHYKDSVYDATHSKAYLDSIDRVTNKIRIQNILLLGQTFSNHEKGRRWVLPSLPMFYYPFQFGGSRLQAGAAYYKTYPSRKHLIINGAISYGFRNKDINGDISINKLYNPFSRGTYHITLEKDFDYIFSGDAWINMIKRNNIYLHQGVGFGHSIELANGLFLFSETKMSFRSSVSGYKTNDKVDSLLGDVLEDNRAIDFPSYNAFYTEARLEYTPYQRYLREPKEKVILGSSWPTFYVLWRKGVPGVLKSVVDFDYLELGIGQAAKLGIMGTLSYKIKSGSFITKRDLRLVDYKYQRRGDPILFMNPNEAFQSLDSTFPVFKRFYEGHALHEFNGAFLNKVPFLKKLGLREVAGAGFLYAPERDLKYAEVFAGIERVFKIPFNQLGKFKIGVYVVGSAANQFRNPVQFKFGITTWDRKTGKWF